MLTMHARDKVPSHNSRLLPTRSHTYPLSTPHALSLRHTHSVWHTHTVCDSSHKNYRYSLQDIAQGAANNNLSSCDPSTPNKHLLSCKLHCPYSPVTHTFWMDLSQICGCSLNRNSLRNLTRDAAGYMQESNIRCTRDIPNPLHICRVPTKQAWTPAEL